MVVVRVQWVQERTKVCYLEGAVATGWSWKRGQQRSLIIYIITKTKGELLASRGKGDCIREQVEFQHFLSAGPLGQA